MTESASVVLTDQLRFLCGIALREGMYESLNWILARMDWPKVDLSAFLGTEAEPAASIADRLAMDPNVSETSPCVRGTWCTVNHVVSLIVEGWTWADILRAQPELREADIRACLEYAARDDAATTEA